MRIYLLNSFLYIALILSIVAVLGAIGMSVQLMQQVYGDRCYDCDYIQHVQVHPIAITEPAQSDEL
jgi:hypothetical protein